MLKIINIKNNLGVLTNGKFQVNIYPATTLLSYYIGRERALQRHLKKVYTKAKRSGSLIKAEK